MILLFFSPRFSMTGNFVFNVQHGSVHSAFSAVHLHSKLSSHLLPHSEAICQGDVMQIFYEQCRAEKKSRAHRNAHSPAGQSDSPMTMRFSMYPALRNYSRSIFRAGEYVLFASAMKLFRQCRRWGLDALGGECC